MNLEMTYYYDLLLIHAGCTLFMMGLIWMVQVVHYPLFAHVGIRDYQQYQWLHMQRITWIVAPIMIIEFISASILLIMNHSPSSTFVSTGFILLLLIWLSTFFFQVPAHSQLSRAWDEQAHTRLVWSNWIRTMAWSIRGIVALYLLRIY